MMDSLLRRFPRLLHTVTTGSMYLQIALIFGLALTPTITVFLATSRLLDGAAWIPQALQWGLAGGVAFLAFIFILAAIVIGICRLFRLAVPAGTFPIASMTSVRWATYNFYILLHRFTVMNFLRATPLHPLFYRLLGAKIGRGVLINSTIISDCNLLSIGDFTVIGGDATVICHSYERGKLILAPVTIGHHVDIGLNSVILPGVTIGDNAVVAAGSIVTKGTTIPPQTIWAGIPARQIRDKSAKHDLPDYG